MEAIALEAITGLVQPNQFDQEFVKSTLLGAFRDYRIWNAFNEESFDERVKCYIKPGFPTAAWNYQSPEHKMYLGEKIYSKPVCRPYSPEQAKQYAVIHCWHEHGHIEFTERDLKKLKGAFDDIDFGDINLGEDAAIEHLMRRKYDLRFRWEDFEDCPPAENARAILFGCIFYEGDLDRIKIEPNFGLEFGSDNVALVFDFYRQLINASDTWARAVIMREFNKVFPKPKNEKSGDGKGEDGPGEGLQDLTASAELQSNPEYAEQFQQDAIGEDGKTDEQREAEEDAKQAGRERGSRNSMVSELSSGKVLIRESRHTPNLVKIKKLASEMSKCFEDKVRYRGTDIPTAKISPKRFLTNPHAPYREKVVVGKGRKTVSVLVDMSGSMQGEPSAGAVDLILVLNELTRRGYIRGNVHFTMGGGRGKYETHELPMADDAIKFIEGHAGSEGLEPAMRKLVPSLRQSDFVFAYTDAAICDQPIEKGYFHKHGINTIGLYVSSEGTQADEVLEYFDRAIARSSIEELVEALVHVILKTR